MSTQEVPEWLNRVLVDHNKRMQRAAGRSSGVELIKEQEATIQTILSNMIDKQAVVEAIGEVESKHCKGSYEPQLCDGKCYIAAGRNQLRTEIRQALNLNGDESDGRRKD